MTEFEKATLAYQEATLESTLAYQEATIAFQEATLEATLAFQEATIAFQEAALTYQAVGLSITAVNALAALVAAVGIWYGIRAMVRANRERAAILDQQREADERRHEETMTAMRERHEEAMRRIDQQGHALETLIASLERQGAALERQTAALETVIERTAPKG